MPPWRKWDGREEEGGETYPVGRFHKVDAQLLHCEDDVLGGLDEVAVYDRSVEEQLLRSEPVQVDDPHLLDDGALPALAGTCAQKHMKIRGPRVWMGSGGTEEAGTGQR